MKREVQKIYFKSWENCGNGTQLPARNSHKMVKCNSRICGVYQMYHIKEHRFILKQSFYFTQNLMKNETKLGILNQQTKALRYPTLPKSN